MAKKVKDPVKPEKKIKKTPAIHEENSDASHKLDFLQWLKMFSSGVQQEKLQSAISDVSREFQDLALALIEAASSGREKPKSSFKLEKIPSEFIRNLSGKISNPYYAIAILCNSNIDFEIKKLVIKDFNKMELTNEDVDYLLNKMNGIKDSNTKEFIWNEFLSSEFLTSAESSTYQLKFLDWGISNNLLVSNPNKTLIGLRNAAAQFKVQETPKRNRTLKKLLEKDIFTFLIFMLHIAQDPISEKFIEQIIAKKNVDVLLLYFENRQALNGPWLENFEQGFISPLLKKTLDSIMQFEDLLPFLNKHSLFVHLLPIDTLNRAVSRCFHRKDFYSELLGDKRVAILENNVEAMRNENSEISEQLETERNRNRQQELKIREFEIAIENYEARLRTQMRSENLGSDALAQNSKIELLKSIVEGLDHLMEGADGYQLERALQKLGVSRVGMPGADFPWDSELCETLTGDAMESGTVVRSGYTWINAGKKLVLKRVLLKLK